MSRILNSRNSDEISCVYINIRSVVGNFSKLSSYINTFEKKPDVIALAEIKLTEKVNLNPMVDIEGYTFEHRKSKTHFGGVGFYISKQLDYKLREDLDLTNKGCDCETLFIEIDTKQKKKQIMGIFLSAS